MKLTPLDLRHVQFARKFYGYDPDEVHRFLDLVRLELESLVQQNAVLKDEIEQALRRLSEYREKEGLLRDALLTARSVGDDLKANAEREAELIIGDAELKAAKMIGEAMHKVQDLRSQIIDLRTQKSALRQSIRHLIARASDWLELDEEADKEAAEREGNVHFFAPPSEAG